jgi:hypothetical protein
MRPIELPGWTVASMLALGAAVEAGSMDPWTPDPFVARPRVVVMTDIANEPDDQMSLVRFLLYCDRFDVEGLVATTSTWLKRGVRPDVIHTVLDGYEKVHENLVRHSLRFPPASHLRRLVVSGQPDYGMAAVGEGRDSPGASLIRRAAAREDPRPLWVLAWGGTNTLAQALSAARRALAPAELDALVEKLRVYAISDQDDAGPWLCATWPCLRRKTARSTTSPRGPGSAATSSTATLRARTSPHSATRG